MDTAGVCQIKPEFILPEKERQLNLNHVSDKDKAAVDRPDETTTGQAPEEAVDSERTEGEDGQSQPKRARGNPKKLKGQNKKRGRTYNHNTSDALCDLLVHVQEGEEVPPCPRKECFGSHNIEEYLRKKPADIGPVCYSFQISGKCSRGLACRFGQSHIAAVSGRNVVDKEKYEQYINKGPYVKNQLEKGVQWALRKKTYNFDLADKLIDSYNRKAVKATPDEINLLVHPGKKTFGAVTDEDIISLRTQEKKKIDWANKLYLASLTTVGNLPFRRICKEFGAEITCGEMAMCSSLLQGMPQEWALMKRHHTEDIFGVQLAANNPHMLVKCGQMLEKECDIDFIDLNLGCPIDWVFKRGGGKHQNSVLIECESILGSGLLIRPKILESCVRNLSTILSIPMTVKARTGAYKDENVTHKLAPQLKEWGASMITIHGRSREQRYTKSADWEYIRQVAINANPVPVFGSGDVLTYDDYKIARETAPEVSGVMLARGALIKPWIFTEIKEARLWDISSKERFDIVKKYVDYGLEHWGSDSRGVENTRKFLLEWLSFLYRYVPVGLLERPPQKINDRPPFYRGRDDLETLMASPAASDWIKLSEMLLGKVPDGFKFIPKHKANSYE
ncbi:hypothetical protein D910_08847 [Dendroctonus ponderosae]|uniref:tRNA-dihydrouridine(47) synthase [NAD(P)(+)] n=1 Tax=Dendroctonus ponderosae TaxID=77166 RepID=U4UEQ6_DENPD|nr:hypothetical protein D910_08847 [Dendroctonus ponderosae]